MSETAWKNNFLPENVFFAAEKYLYVHFVICKYFWHKFNPFF